MTEWYVKKHSICTFLISIIARTYTFTINYLHHYLSIDLSDYLSIYLPSYPHIHPFDYLPTYLPTYLPICVSVYTINHLHYYRLTLSEAAIYQS